MTKVRNMFKLPRNATKIKKHVLTRHIPAKPLRTRRGLKKLAIRIRLDKKAHPNYQLPTHCYRTESPDHKSIMEDDDHLYPVESRWTIWVNMLNRFVTAVLAPLRATR